MGYDAALSQLRGLLAESGSGNGRLALVEGGLASGKTHLLHEFSRQATKSGALVLTATGSRAERELPMGIVDQLFRSAGPAAPLPEHAARLIGITDGTDGTDEQTGPCGADQLTPYGTLDTTVRELCGLLLDGCADQPLVLAVDDVQFADAPSLRLLLSLQRRMVSARLLIVLNEWHRGKPTLPEFRAELTRHPYTQIRLAPLSVEDITTLLAKETSVPEPAPVAQGYHRLTGGNPMLLHAALDDRAGAVSADEDADRDGPVVGVAYAQAVLAGLYRWDAELLSVARAAAVLGDRSTPALIAQLLGSRPEDTEELVRILVDAGLLLGWRSRLPERDAGRAARLTHRRAEPGTGRAADFGQLPPVAVAALANPAVGAAEADTPAWRAAEIPAANGHGTARAVAALYGVVAGRGRFDGRRVLSPEAAERVREGQGSCRDLVLGAGFEGETEAGLGLWLSGPQGSYGPNPRACGHDGFGGSCGLADPEAGVSLGYVMNRMGPHIADDPRKTALVGALYDAL
ncbi:AAA family ATPase [Streptomyces cinereospinus]|uniref:AAA family ATPase n=1 Tax=Streptomyces cinereospinus TaxID=285561 RepID=A0ABV5N4N4_9ACTN